MLRNSGIRNYLKPLFQNRFPYYDFLLSVCVIEIWPDVYDFTLSSWAGELLTKHKEKPLSPLAGKFPPPAGQNHDARVMISCSILDIFETVKLFQI